MLYEVITGLAGLKFSNWEGGVRVPLIYHWPGKIEGGKVLNPLVANYDLLSTFADMLDVEVHNEKDGLSYWPALFGNSSEKHEYVVFNSKLRITSYNVCYTKLLRSRCHGTNGEGTEAPALNSQEFLNAATNGYILATMTIGRDGTRSYNFV